MVMKRETGLLKLFPNYEVIFFGSISIFTRSQMRESNPGRLGESAMHSLFSPFSPPPPTGHLNSSRKASLYNWQLTTDSCSFIRWKICCCCCCSCCCCCWCCCCCCCCLRHFQSRRVDASPRNSDTCFPWLDLSHRSAAPSVRNSYQLLPKKTTRRDETRTGRNFFELRAIFGLLPLSSCHVRTLICCLESFES